LFPGGELAELPLLELDATLYREPNDAGLTVVERKLAKAVTVDEIDIKWNSTRTRKETRDLKVSTIHR